MPLSQDDYIIKKNLYRNCPVVLTCIAAALRGKLKHVENFFYIDSYNDTLNQLDPFTPRTFLKKDKMILDPSPPKHTIYELLLNSQSRKIDGAIKSYLVDNILDVGYRMELKKQSYVFFNKIIKKETIIPGGDVNEIFDIECMDDEVKMWEGISGVVGPFKGELEKLNGELETFLYKLETLLYLNINNMYILRLICNMLIPLEENIIYTKQYIWKNPEVFKSATGNINTILDCMILLYKIVIDKYKTEGEAQVYSFDENAKHRRNRFGILTEEDILDETQIYKKFEEMNYDAIHDPGGLKTKFLDDLYDLTRLNITVTKLLTKENIPEICDTLSKTLEYEKSEYKKSEYIPPRLPPRLPPRRPHRAIPPTPQYEGIPPTPQYEGIQSNRSLYTTSQIEGESQNAWERRALPPRLILARRKRNVLQPTTPSPKLQSDVSGGNESNDINVGVIIVLILLLLMYFAIERPLFIGIIFILGVTCVIYHHMNSKY